MSEQLTNVPCHLNTMLIGSKNTWIHGFQLGLHELADHI